MVHYSASAIGGRNTKNRHNAKPSNVSHNYIDIPLEMKLLLIVPILILNSCFQKTNEAIYEIKNKTTDKKIGAEQKAILAVAPAEWNVDDSYHVYILFDNEAIEGNGYGIVFSANDWDNVLPRDDSKIKLTWISDDTLKISYDKRLRILNQVIKTRDNVIVYEEMSSPNHNISSR